MLLLALFLGSVLISVALVVLGRLSHRKHSMRGTDDVESAYVTAIATLYGVFVAFMIFTVWTRYYGAEESITTEADTIAETYRMAGGLESPIREELQSLLLEYAHSVVDDEWNTMRHGKSSPRTEAIVQRIWRVYNRMSREVGDQVLRDHLLTSWTGLADRRRMRLLWSYTGLNYYAYVVLFVGALITVGLASLFTVDDFRMHAIKAASVGAIIALMLATVWGLGHPFRGQVGLQPIAFEQVIRNLSAER